jgi:hypothetical protein
VMDGASGVVAQFGNLHRLSRPTRRNALRTWIFRVRVLA